MFKSALADMVVASRARKGEVVGEQDIERVQVLFSHAAYHLRIISSFVKFCSPSALVLAGPDRLAATSSAQVPVASIFLRDTVVLVIVRSPFHDVVRKASFRFDMGRMFG